MSLLPSLFGSRLPSISALEVSEKLKNDKGTLILDVRQPEEYSQGHIAGSKLIPLSELVGRLNELPKDREVVCVCATGSRSRSATKLLLSHEYHAFDMTGGMFIWLRSRLPIKKGNSA